MTTADDTRQYEVGVCVDTDDERAATAVETVIDETYPVHVQRYEEPLFDGPVNDDEDDPAVDDWEATLVEADGTVVLTDQPLDLGDDDMNNSVRATKYGAVPPEFSFRNSMSVLSTAGARETPDPIGVLRTAAVQAVALALGRGCGYYGGGRCAANCASETDLLESGEFICSECRRRMGSRNDGVDLALPLPGPEGPYPLTSSVTLRVCPDVSSVAVEAAVAELEDRFAITPTVVDADPLSSQAYDPDRDQYELDGAMTALPFGDDVQFTLTRADLFHGHSNNWVFGAGYGGDKALLSTHRLRPVEPDDDRFTARVRKQTTTMIGRCVGRLCEADADCVLAYSSTVTAVDRKPAAACEACRTWWQRSV